MNKTGSMDGIRTLAGYAGTSSHGQVRFVISLTSSDDEMRFRLRRAIKSGSLALHTASKASPMRRVAS